MKQQDAKTLALPGTDQIHAWILSALYQGEIRISTPCENNRFIKSDMQENLFMVTNIFFIEPFIKLAPDKTV